MFDIWWGDIELTTLTVIVSVLLLLPMQLLLSFKAKRSFVRLLPVILLSALTVLLLILSLTAPGLEKIVWLCLAIFAAFMTFVCGIGWGIWWIAARRKQPRSTK